MLGRVAFAAALLLGGAAGAADLYAPDPGPLRPGFAPELPPPAFSWTGGHLGIEIGGTTGASARVGYASGRVLVYATGSLA